MARPWISQIRNARSSKEQIAALRALKNELIGHPLKKEAVVASGVLDPVVRLSSNRAVSRQDGKSHDHSFASRPLTEEELVRLQGLHVIASIALGKNSIPSYHITVVNTCIRRPSFSSSITKCPGLAGHSIKPLPIE
jgi:hypothetical protein